MCDVTWHTSRDKFHLAFSALFVLQATIAVVEDWERGYVGAGPAGPVWPHHFFGDLIKFIVGAPAVLTYASSASPRITNGIFCFSCVAQPAKVAEFPKALLWEKECGAEGIQTKLV